jgi:hypothetical protein
MAPIFLNEMTGEKGNNKYIGGFNSQALVNTVRGEKWRM